MFTIILWLQPVSAGCRAKRKSRRRFAGIVKRAYNLPP